MSLAFDGVLFFPVTPFTKTNSIATAILRQHIEARILSGAGAVFVACGTGEFASLTNEEWCDTVSVASDVAKGRVPVVAGVGGPIGNAQRMSEMAEQLGIDGLLLLPPYLQIGPERGLRTYVRGVLEASHLPVILYNRSTARFSPSLVAQLALEPQIIGVKDGVGDLAWMQEVVVRLAQVDRQIALFNGMPTAELYQAAYQGVGVSLYSSAVFAMVPDVANAYYQSLRAKDDNRREQLLNEFYFPFARLRDEVPGFAVALIKAGLRIQGLDVGSVRSPLSDPSPGQLRQLARLIAHAQELVSH